MTLWPEGGMLLFTYEYVSPILAGVQCIPFYRWLSIYLKNVTDPFCVPSVPSCGGGGLLAIGE